MLNDIFNKLLQKYYKILWGNQEIYISGKEFHALKRKPEDCQDCNWQIDL